MTPNPQASAAATPQEVFQLGLCYEHAAVLLAMATMQSQGGPFSGSYAFGGQPPELLPMAVCQSFSVELYLKSLIWLECGAAPRRDHLLTSLMNQVTPARSGRIRHHYDARLAPNKARYEASATPTFGPGTTDFDPALAAASNSFVLWRYAYERGMADGPNLANYLACAVRRTILEVRPDWQPLTAGLRLM